MTLQLRQYQVDCLQNINENYQKGINRQLVHLPTAAGKTVIFGSLIQQLKRKTIVLAHTCELLGQAKDKIEMIAPGLNVGIVKADCKEFGKSIVVSSIQSARQPETLSELQKQGFSLCIYDECHRAAASSPRQILSSLGFSESSGSSGNLLVGFSATQFRTDSKGLGEVFDKLVYHKSIKDLIELGYLCKPVGIKIATDLDLSKVKTEDGDFVKASLASVMDNDEMNDIIINSFIDKAADRKTVCFAVTVDHAKNLAEAFKRRGIASEAVSGDMSQSERENVLERFQSGKIQVITNCQILTEGWDCPEVNCILIAKPTQSRGLYQQMAGRGLRLFPNKTNCLILDFGSATHSLCGITSLVCDAEQEEVKQRREETFMSEFAKTLPPSINKKLRSAIIEFDLLGDAFTWIKEGLTYSLKGNNERILKIFPTADSRFSTMLFKGNNLESIVARDLSFEYAFAAAEEYAKANKELFTVSDLSASWRELPISDKQKGLFRSHGFRAGIDDLSRGQAALIISSRILNKKAVRR